MEMSRRWSLESVVPCKSGEESTRAHDLMHFARVDRIKPLTPRTHDGAARSIVLQQLFLEMEWKHKIVTLDARSCR